MAVGSWWAAGGAGTGGEAGVVAEATFDDRKQES